MRTPHCRTSSLLESLSCQDLGPLLDTASSRENLRASTARLKASTLKSQGHKVRGARTLGPCSPKPHVWPLAVYFMYLAVAQVNEGLGNSHCLPGPRPRPGGSLCTLTSAAGDTTLESVGRNAVCSAEQSKRCRGQRSEPECAQQKDLHVLRP